VQKSFQHTGLELKKWEAINGKNLSQEYIKKVTSRFCNYFCSNSMIGIWLSHYNLWKHIADHKMTNVLILEDDAKPVDKFNEKFNEYWTNMPENWDIIFLGCFQCDGSTKGKKDFINDNPYLFIPDFPAGMHGYMISHTGAEKLVRELKNVEYHIDIFLSSKVFNNPKKNIKMYGFKPYLIYQDSESESDNQGHTHLLLTKTVQLIEQQTQLPWSTQMNSQLYNIRYLDIPITVTTQSIFILALLLNLLPFPRIRQYSLIALVLYECCEVAFTKHNWTRTKTIMFELIVIGLITLIGTYVGIPLTSKIFRQIEKVW
jgi:GR25 family glycosyltransferase involved in LPS biosynthesis